MFIVNWQAGTEWWQDVAPTMMTHRHTVTHLCVFTAVTDDSPFNNNIHNLPHICLSGKSLAGNQIKRYLFHLHCTKIPTTHMQTPHWQRVAKDYTTHVVKPVFCTGQSLKSGGGGVEILNLRIILIVCVI